MTRFQRAKSRVDALIEGYERPLLPAAQEQALRQMMSSLTVVGDDLIHLSVF